jgi:hypothetical protein
MNSIFGQRMRQRPPICPACNRPVIRAHKVVESQYADDGDEAFCCICMECGTLWRMALDYTGEIVLCPPSDSDRKRFGPDLAKLIKTIKRNRQIADARGITVAELADYTDKFLGVWAKVRRFDA